MIIFLELGLCQRSHQVFLFVGQFFGNINIDFNESVSLARTIVAGQTKVLEPELEKAQEEIGTVIRERDMAKDENLKLQDQLEARRCHLSCWKEVDSP